MTTEPSTTNAGAGDTALETVRKLASGEQETSAEATVPGAHPARPK
jgi:hypothetical protein